MFDVEVISPGPWNEAWYVRLKANSDKYWGIVQYPDRANIEAIYTDKNEATRFIVLEAK